jgi:hypothetical protein
VAGRQAGSADVKNTSTKNARKKFTNAWQRTDGSGESGQQDGIPQERPFPLALIFTPSHDLLRYVYFGVRIQNAKMCVPAKKKQAAQGERGRWVGG